MCEHNPVVPERILDDFASSLFSCLYYCHNMRSQQINISDYFNETIAEAVFLMEKKTRQYNFVIIERHRSEIEHPSFFSKVYDLYTSDYFRKLYYFTALIFDLILLTQLESNGADLTKGPRLWKLVFRRYFDVDFVSNGQWKGFTEAGLTVMDNKNDKFYFLPRFFKYKFVFAGSSTSSYKPLMEDFMDDVISSLGKLSIEKMETDEVVENPDKSAKGTDENVEEADESAKRRKESVEEAGESEKGTEDNQQMQVDENPNPPVAEIKEQPVERIQRKRRHDAAPSRSETGLDSPSHSKAKIDKKESTC